jgi:hypothetical protein
MTHTLKEIVKKGNIASISYVCEGKVYYNINVGISAYQLELNSMDEEWKATYLLPNFSTISLMRWIRKGIEKQDGTFIQIK